MADSRQSMALHLPRKTFAKYDTTIIDYIVKFKDSATDQQIDDAIKQLGTAGAHDLVLNMHCITMTKPLQ